LSIDCYFFHVFVDDVLTNSYSVYIYCIQKWLL